MLSIAIAESATNHASPMDMHGGVDMQGGEGEPNLSLAPEEIASLSFLMRRYDQVLVEVDALNLRLQELLELEAPARANPDLASGI